MVEGMERRGGGGVGEMRGKRRIIAMNNTISKSPSTHCSKGICDVFKCVGLNFQGLFFKYSINLRNSYLY
jgi:hypothetical protein